jgi:hypothetical protein
LNPAKIKLIVQERGILGIKFAAFSSADFKNNMQGKYSCETSEGIQFINNSSVDFIRNFKQEFL